MERSAACSRIGSRGGKCGAFRWVGDAAYRIQLLYDDRLMLLQPDNRSVTELTVYLLFALLQV